MKALRSAFAILAAAISSLGSAQTFSYQHLGDTVSYEQPATNDIVVQGNIVNTGNTMLEIDIIRKENNLPSGWDSYLCADICLAPFVDSTRLYLPAGSTQNFKVSFITTNVQDTANCLVLLKNVNNPNNKVLKRYYGITSTTAGLNERREALTAIVLSPNPVRDQLSIQTDETELEIRCVDAAGRKMALSHEQRAGGFKIGTEQLPAGIYILQIGSSAGTVQKKFVKN